MVVTLFRSTVAQANMSHIQLHEIALLAGLYDESSANVTFFYRGTEFVIDCKFSERTTPTLKEYKAALRPIESHERELAKATRDMLQLLLLPRQGEISARIDETVAPRCPVCLDRLLEAAHIRIAIDENDTVFITKDATSPTYHLRPVSLREAEHSGTTYLPRFSPSEVVFEDFDPSIPSLQKKVQLSGDKRAFFKPVEDGRHDEILRELRVQSAMQKNGVSKAHLVSSLLGLVTTRDDGFICGLIYHHIEARPLARIDAAKKKAKTARWRQQISEFLRALHAVGEAWGDVNDCNILIDDADDGGNAWAVDFGGKAGTDYSLMNLDEVQQQDWVELRQMFEEEDDDSRGD